MVSCNPSPVLQLLSTEINPVKYKHNKMNRCCCVWAHSNTGKSTFRNKGEKKKNPECVVIFPVRSDPFTCYLQQMCQTVL